MGSTFAFFNKDLSKDSTIIKIILVSYNNRFFFYIDHNVLGIYFV